MAYGRTGIGEYDKTKNWGWMFNPPPYDFLDPKGVRPPPEFIAPSASMYLANSRSGLGCSAGACTCRGKCGMGQFDFSSIQTTLTNPVTVFGFTFPLWIGLAAGVGAIALFSGKGKKSWF